MNSFNLKLPKLIQQHHQFLIQTVTVYNLHADQGSTNLTRITVENLNGSWIQSLNFKPFVNPLC